MLVVLAVVRTVTNAVVTIMAPAPVRTQSLVIIFTLTLLCCGRVKYGGYSHMAGYPPPLLQARSPLCPLFRLRGFDWTTPRFCTNAIALIIDPTWLPQLVHQSKHQEVG